MPHAKVVALAFSQVAYKIVWVGPIRIILWVLLCSWMIQLQGVTQTGNQMKRRRLIFPTVIPLGIIPKDEPRFTGVIVTIPSKGLRVRHCWVSGFTDVHTSHSNLAFRSDSQKIVLSHRENVFSTTVILHGEPFFVWSKGNFGSNVHPGARIVSGIVGNKTSAFPCTLKPHFFIWHCTLLQREGFRL